MMGERRLGDVEQRHQLADTDLSGVLAQHVDELQANRVTEGLGDLGHTQGAIALDVGVDDGLATALSSGSLLLRGKLHIDEHQSTYINNTYICQCNTIRAVNDLDACDSRQRLLPSEPAPIRRVAA